jgi:exonuclease SbcD
MMKIYHVADIHLGRKRLDGRLPDQDLVEAFRFIAQAAIHDQADIFLIAGDLFDRPQVEPAHLRQAQDVLRLLMQAGIPVVAVEGNHDKTFVHSGEQTWVQFLAEEDLLILLRPGFGAEGAVLDRWNEKTKAGSWIEIDGVRFIGAGYLGGVRE